MGKQILIGLSRGPLLRRRAVLPIEVVYEKRTSVPNEYLLLWIFD